jgi:hypothetical protein
MITVLSLMSFSETKEMSQMPFVKFQVIEPILQKEFSTLTVNDFYLLSETPIFDLNFVDLLFSELYKRYLDHPNENPKTKA